MAIYSKPSKNRDFEKVTVDEWLNGNIESVQLRENVKKQYKDDEGVMQERVIDQVRLKLKIDGCQYPHYSRWMTNSLNERSNLFLLLAQMYPNLSPDTCVNLSNLEGLKVRTMWVNVTLSNGDIYQALDKIRPLEELPEITADMNETVDEGDSLKAEIDPNDVPF